MTLYLYLRRHFPPLAAALILGSWWGFLLFLAFIGLSALGTDLRYENL